MVNGEYNLKTARLGALRKWAREPSTPTKVLECLAYHDDELIRQRVAANLSTPPLHWAKLGSDRDPVVRQAILDNPGTPSQIKAIMRESGD